MATFETHAIGDREFVSTVVVIIVHAFTPNAVPPVHCGNLDASDT
jgi:hypothetical protein